MSITFFSFRYFSYFSTNSSNTRILICSNTSKEVVHTFCSFNEKKKKMNDTKSECNCLSLFSLFTATWVTSRHVLPSCQRSFETAQNGVLRGSIGHTRICIRFLYLLLYGLRSHPFFNAESFFTVTICCVVCVL